MPGHFRAGVARYDITPSLGTQLMGYPDPYGHRKAEAVRDNLHATALAFESADGSQTAAVVSLDVAIIEDAQVAEIRKQAGEKTGIDPGHITVCAIQTHSAPRTQRVFGWCEIDTDYVDLRMVPGAVSAIVAAFEKRVPARMGIGTVESRAGVNRRQFLDNHNIGLGQNRWGVYDPTMTVLRFDTADGVLANLVHYGAHPTVFGSASRVISRDWPGIMIDRVEELTGAPTLYVNGAVGDIAPRTNSMSAVGDERHKFEAALQETGAVAGMDAMDAWRSIRDSRAVDLNVVARSFDMPYRPLPSLDVAKKEFAAAEPKKDEPGAGMCEYKHWQCVVEELQGTPKTAKPYHQVVTSLGPVALVPMPGEPFGETVMRLRTKSPFEHTLALSTSCGNFGYFPTRESLHRGGYEVWVAKAFGAYILAENIDDVLIDENCAMLGEVYERAYPAIPSA